jgi:hypothetical protein
LFLIKFGDRRIFRLSAISISKTCGRCDNALIAHYQTVIGMKKSRQNGWAAVTGRRFKHLAGLKPRPCGFSFQCVCPLESEHTRGRVKLPLAGSMADYISIPAAARRFELSELPMSVRLKNVLGWKACRLLGDLDGVRFSELARWRNCGKVTVLELMGIVRCLQHGNWQSGKKPDPEDMAGNFEV